LLHTLRTQLDIFQKVIPTLAQRFTVYALDFPGHGYSDIPKVDYEPELFVEAAVGFLDELEITDATLAGISIGGTVRQGDKDSRIEGELAMPKQAFYWQLYIASYTALLGIPLLFFPKSALPLIGFDASMVDQAPFVRLTGMFLLCLTLITFRIWQKKIEEMVLGTVIIRLFIVVTALTVGIAGGFPFLFIVAGIVGVGVLGTLWSLRKVELLHYL